MAFRAIERRGAHGVEFRQTERRPTPARCMLRGVSPAIGTHAARPRWRHRASRFSGSTKLSGDDGESPQAPRFVWASSSAPAPAFWLNLQLRSDLYHVRRAEETATGSDCTVGVIDGGRRRVAEARGPDLACGGPRPRENGVRATSVPQPFSPVSASHRSGDIRPASSSRRVGGRSRRGSRTAGRCLPRSFPALSPEVPESNGIRSMSLIVNRTSSTLALDMTAPQVLVGIAEHAPRRALSPDIRQCTPAVRSTRWGPVNLGSGFPAWRSISG